MVSIGFHCFSALSALLWNISVVYEVEDEVKIWENTKEYLLSNPTDLEKKYLVPSSEREPFPGKLEKKKENYTIAQ